MVVGDREILERKEVKPMVKVVDGLLLEFPRIMGCGPVPLNKSALGKTEYKKPQI